jgi:hypothetical protein
MNWKKYFKEGKEIVLATSSKKSAPNANIVISLGFADEKLLVANCQMKSTIKNLKENPSVCVVGGYFRIRGKANIFSSGKYFDICVQKSKGHFVKNAILISTDEVFDLDNVKLVFNSA